MIIINAFMYDIRPGKSELECTNGCRNNARPEDCLRFAVACGAESTQHFGAGVLEQREVERLVPDVRVERLETPALALG